MNLHARWAQRTAERLGLTHVFRPRLAFWMAIFASIVGILWLIAAARYSLSTFGEQLPLVAFFGLALYLTCVRPFVAVGDRGVLVRNVIRDVHIPWDALEGIDTQYALTLTTTDGQRVRAWAAPAPSRFSASRATPSDIAAIDWDGDDGPPPASATLQSDSGAAAILIRRRWRSVGRPDHASDRTTRTRWAWPEIAALFVTLAASAVVLAQ